MPPTLHPRRRHANPRNLGLSRPAAAEFSFLLGIPTLLAAGGLEIFQSLRHSHITLVQWRMTLLGASVAAVTAFMVVQWLMRFIQKHTFISFGWYRIILGAALLLKNYK